MATPILDPLRLTPKIRTAATVAAVVVGLTWCLGRVGTAADDGPGSPADRATAITPAVDVVAIAGQVLRFDARTGAMHQFEGDLSVKGSGTRWRVRVAPTPDPTSGFLSLHTHRIDERDVHVLVDDVSGTSWLLRLPERDLGRWTRLSVQTP